MNRRPGRCTLRSAVSVAVGVVRSLAGLLGHYVTDVPPLSFDALERARWQEMVESASVYRSGANGARTPNADPATAA